MNKKTKKIMSVLNIVMIAVLVGCVTLLTVYAAWSHMETSKNNTLNIGSVEVNLDREEGGQTVKTYFNTTLTPRGEAFAPVSYADALAQADADNGVTIADAKINVSRSYSREVAYSLTVDDSDYANNAQLAGSVSLLCYKLNGAIGVPTAWNGVAFGSAGSIDGTIGNSKDTYHLFVTAGAAAADKTFEFDFIVESSEIEILKTLAISGISANTFMEGYALPSVSEDSIEVSAVYTSGNTTLLDPSEYTLDIDTGVARIGAGITATLNSDPSIYATAHYNVSTIIDTKAEHITNAEGANASLRTADWHNGALNANFIQNSKLGTTITYTVEATTAGTANLTLSGSSGWVTKYFASPKTPEIKGDMQANVIFDLYVNDVFVGMDDSVLFLGGTYENAVNNNLVDWHPIDIGDVYFESGTNIIELRFKEHTYRNAGAAAGDFASPYIDYLVITSSNDAVAPDVTSIAVTSQPSKTEYIEGQYFDRAGMVVTATFAGGGTAVINDYTYNIAAFSMSDSSITLTYLGCSTTVSVNIIARIASSIEITRDPDKIEYTVGQELDLSGIEVTATFNDGSTEVVNGYTCLPDGPLALSDTVVTISYGGHSDTFNITVENIDLIRSIIIAGVSNAAVSEGDALPTIEPSSITVSALYYSGTTVVLDPSDYDLVIDTGTAQIGSGVTATLKSDTSIKATVPFKVSKTIDTKAVNITAAGTGPAELRGNAAWHNGALNADFIQNPINGAIITYTFDAACAATATLTLSGSSGWVTKYEGTPKEKGDMQANVMFDLYVNGVLVPMADSVIFRGGVYATARNENLADWHLIDLANVLLAEGTNTVELKFKAFSYLNATTGSPASKPYIDYFVVSI